MFAELPNYEDMWPDRRQTKQTNKCGIRKPKKENVVNF